MNWKRWIGHDKFDNVIVGFLLGMTAIALVYYLQLRHYALPILGDSGIPVQVPLLKLSLLGALGVFLILNYLDKLNAAKGVIISVILTGIYLIYLMFLR